MHLNQFFWKIKLQSRKINHNFRKIELNFLKIRLASEYFTKRRIGSEKLYLIMGQKIVGRNKYRILLKIV